MAINLLFILTNFAVNSQFNLFELDKPSQVIIIQINQVKFDSVMTIKV